MSDVYAAGSKARRLGVLSAFLFALGCAGTAAAQGVPRVRLKE